MPELHQIKARTAEIIIQLDRLSSRSDNLCVMAATGGTATGYPELEELEGIRIRTEELRRQFDAIKHKSRLDAEVMETERKLEEALNRYFLLWHKCKRNGDDEEAPL
jgi:hypothetical protein